MPSWGLKFLCCCHKPPRMSQTCRIVVSEVGLETPATVKGRHWGFPVPISILNKRTDLGL